MTAFGLAALAVPAQADAGHAASAAARDLGGDNPLGGLLGGLTNGGLLNGAGNGLLGGLLNSAAPQPAGAPSGPRLQPGTDRLAESEPLSGRASSRRPALRNGPIEPPPAEVLHGTFTSVSHLVEGALGTAMSPLSATRSMTGDTRTTNSATRSTDTTSRTMDTTTRTMDTTSRTVDTATRTVDTATRTVDTATRALSGGATATDSVMAVSRATRYALPRQSANGRLAPLVGHLVPTELAPPLDTLPGTTQVASIDEIAPLVEDAAAVVSTNGVEATSAYTDTVNSLGWATAALTSTVRDPWHQY
ncbi:hypothetical protein OUY22_15555 [Nonomuraea sp. MCN248]|uniref:Uncharacterized protein n=1 Tax=Nonomuraea corallina TaxID=2989783 RepID=A0ABT4SCD0_9ACTN|nr:hypothetical protein [Nonomuraea corallina]MDA0634839.1 hypothetical protein [Nonomuraea corallina]